MSEKELRDFKGMLIRDYNDIIRCVQKCRETLAQTLNKIARQEAFQDASYKTPLENMLKVCDNAAKVLRQLNITLESYDSLMKQLEVDISLVETEKKNVTELLEDYVQNIHKNLEKIGRNSTIKIREKSIKMLKVILPVWEDNEKLYSLRLSDLWTKSQKKVFVYLKITKMPRKPSPPEFFATWFQLICCSLCSSIL